jgi:hypothetical protein
MQRSLLAAFPLLVFLTGCITNDPNAARTVGGQVLGSGEWRPIAAGESRLSFDNPPGPVIGYQERTLPTRIQQSYRYAAGVALFESSGTNQSFGEVASTAIYPIEAVSKDPEVVARRISTDLSNIKRGRARIGPYAIAAGTGASFECNLFQLYFEGSIRNYDNGAMYQAYLRGFWCGMPGHSRERVDADTVSFLQSIHFDNGLLNRARASAPNSTPPQSQSVQPQTAPSGASSSFENSTDRAMRAQIKTNFDSNQQSCVSKAMTERRIPATTANSFCTCVASEMLSGITTRELPLMLELGRGTADDIRRMQVGRFESAMQIFNRVTQAASAKCPATNF